MSEFSYRSVLPFSQQRVFDYHMSPGALSRLIPPWEPISILSKTSPGVTLNSQVQLRVPLAPFLYKTWLAEHTEVSPPHSFTDEQRKGPFARWTHQHRFTALTPESTELHDSVRFALPLAPLSTLFAGWFVRKKLQRTFQFRHTRTQNDLQHLQFTNPKKPLTVLITGATGLVGRNLSALLEAAGHTVLTLSRGETSSENAYQWNLQEEVIPQEALERADAVVHLAGENIAGKRWSEAQKKKILESRVLSTRLLVQAMKECTSPPEVFLSASAVGFYGNQADEILTEQSTAPTDSAFTSYVASLWEQEAQQAQDAGIRTIIGRIGVVLTPEDGALKKMLPAFQAGIAGRLGTGKQWMSCIAIDDLVYAIHFLLTKPDATGIFNLVSPEPITNKEFTSLLGKLLKRPTLLPVSQRALFLALGEMSQELLLASCRAIPERLISEGFHFSYPTIESSLRFVLGIPDETNKK